MIQLNTIREIDDQSTEGKLLIAAVAILTSISEKDIKNNIWGGLVSPDQGIKQIQELANKIYHKKEWEAYLRLKKRDEKIDKLINDKT